MAAVEKFKQFALGLDFGTQSVRALVVNIDTGEEAAQAVVSYPAGVISRKLPFEGAADLPSDFALQNPLDYKNSMLAAIAQVLKAVPASHITGIGIDFTACTMLPILKDGTPLMALPQFKNNPHAWAKLWKHHGAKSEADLINEFAHARSEPFLKYVGGTVSSEWMLPKCWEIANHAPDIYAATDFMIDAGDWITYLLTGKLTRNSCAAGYKGLWSQELGFPSQEFLETLDPKLRTLKQKWVQEIIAPGKLAGLVTRNFAELSGLCEGTPVSAATIDAHSGVAGMGVFHEGPMCIIMGTSSCHMALSTQLKLFEGFAGVVKDGILPGFYGYESGQAAVGDLFAWFAKDIVEGDWKDLSERAEALSPGTTGLMALDWVNGNRSVLMNPYLSGLIVGLTLDTRPEHIYRALVEATAMGTRKIIQSYQENGVPVHELVVCGGLSQHPWIMQIYADVMGLPVKVAASSQAVALGAAIFGAMAAREAQGTEARDFEALITQMTKPAVANYLPTTDAQKTYNDLFNVYCELHDYFGVTHSDLMKKLRRPS